MDLLATVLRYPPKQLCIENTIQDIAIIGRPLVTPEILNIAQRRNGKKGNLGKFGEVLYSIYVIKNFFFIKKKSCLVLGS